MATILIRDEFWLNFWSSTTWASYRINCASVGLQRTSSYWTSCRCWSSFSKVRKRNIWPEIKSDAGRHLEIDFYQQLVKVVVASNYADHGSLVNMNINSRSTWTGFHSSWFFYGLGNFLVFCRLTGSNFCASGPVGYPNLWSWSCSKKWMTHLNTHLQNIYI
jgi:hypothetical protein